MRDTTTVYDILFVDFAVLVDLKVDQSLSNLATA